MSDTTDLPWRIFQNINGFIASADAKASGILAAEGVILGVVLGNLKSVVEALSGWAPATLAIIAATALSASFFFALQCLTPRLKINYPTGPASLIYFKSVAAMDYTVFADGLKRMANDEPHAVEHIGQQAWINAHIATAKFTDVQRSLRLFGLAVLLAILATLGAFI